MTIDISAPPSGNFGFVLGVVTRISREMYSRIIEKTDSFRTKMACDNRVGIYDVSSYHMFISTSGVL